MDFKEIRGISKSAYSSINSSNNSHKQYIPALHSNAKDTVSFSGGKKSSGAAGGILSFVKSLFKKSDEKSDVNIENGDSPQNNKNVTPSVKQSSSLPENSKYSVEEKRKILLEKAEKRRDFSPRYDMHYIHRLELLPENEFEKSTALLDNGATVEFAEFAVSKFPEKTEIALQFLYDGVNEDFIKSVALYFDDKQTEQAKELTGIFSQKYKKFGSDEFDLKYNTTLLNNIYRTSRLDEKRFADALRLTSRDDFNYSYFYDFSCLDEVKFQRAQTLLDNEVDEFRALYTARLNDENYNSLQTLVEKGFSFDDISQFSLYGDEKFSRAINRGYFEKYPLNTVKAFVQIDDNVWNSINKDGFLEEYISLNSENLNSRDASYIGENMQGAGEIGLALKKYSRCENFADLTSGDKRLILSLLTSPMSDLFSEKSVALQCSDGGAFVPRNKEEYCALVSSLAENVGIKVNFPSSEANRKFVDGLNALDDINSPLRDINLDSPVFKVSLEYSKEDFCSDVASVISDIPDKDKKTVCNLFGFQLQKEGESVQLKGYPVNIENDAEINFVKNPLLKEKIDEIRPFVERFSNENKIKVNSSPELEKILNEISGVLPEFQVKIGKKQGENHDYTSDIQTLKMLQNVIRNKDYSSLPDNDKKLLKIVVLLSGINAKEGVLDNNSPENSAYDSYYILSKTDLSERDKTIVYDLIKNIDKFEEYLSAGSSTHDFMKQSKVVMKTAFNLRKGNELQMMKILMPAYLKSFRKDNAYYKEIKQSYSDFISKLSEKSKEIKSTRIYLPQSKMPSASEIKPDGVVAQRVKSTTKDGKVIENTVINLQPGIDLSKIGFENGLMSDDLCVFLHGLDAGYQTSIFNTAALPDSQVVLSTSYVRYGENAYHVFRPQGLIVENDCDDIHAAFCKDFGSGVKKDFDTIYREYLFCGNLFRNYISDGIKEKLNIDGEEYSKLYDEISQKSLTELDKDNTEVAETMRQVIHDAAGESRIYNRKYNEALVSRPKIKGVFCYGENGYNDLPDFLKEFASKNNLPVLYFGK